MSESNVNFLDDQTSKRGKVSQLILVGLALTLPFSETQWYYSIINSPKNFSNLWFYLFLVFFAALTFGIMILCLMITESQFRQYLPRIKDTLDSEFNFRSIFSKSHIKQTIVLFVGLILIKLATEGWNPMKLLMFFGDHVELFLLAGILSYLLPVITRAIYSLVRVFIAGQFEKPLQQVVNDWSLVLIIMPLYTMIFFLFTAAFTSSFKFSPPFDQSVANYWRSYWKDLILLNIIAGLYLGTFKLIVHRATIYLFKNPRDFLFFAAACSVIAVLAVHSEFTNVGGSRPIGPTEVWQFSVTQYHVNIRDIGFFLLPIAIYLFWMFRCVVRDIAKDERRTSRT